MKYFKIVIFFIIIVITICLIMSCDKSFEKILMKLDVDSNVEKNIQNEPNLDACNVALLGVVQGVTEFLPVSSTGHMILVEHLFNKNDSARPSIRQNAMNAYFTIIQSGSIFAILIMYWRRVRNMFEACLFRSKRGGYLVRNFMLSFLPAGILGLFFDGVLQNALYNPLCIACALLFGAFLMMYAEVQYNRNRVRLNEIQRNDSDEIVNLPATSCVKIGLWQCLALIPGMSRSMSTIVGGYFCGMSKKSAAEYSFLLGFVTLSAATIFKLLKDYDVLFQYFSAWTFLEGVSIAFVFSLLTMRLFIAYLGSHGLWLFVWYRVALGISVLFLLK